MGYKPSLAQERMLSHLRRYHERSGMSLRDVERLCGWANGKASKTLRGLQGITLDDLNKLMAALNVPERDYKRLRTLRTQGRVKHLWWDDHPWIAVDFGRYIAAEDSAVDIQTLCSNYFPGLLQSIDYMCGLFKTAPRIDKKVSQEDAVNVRLNRQKVIQKSSLTYRVAVSELAFMNGPAGLVGDAVAHVRDVVEQGLVELRIIPKSTLAPATAFDLFTLPSEQVLAATEMPLIGAVVFDEPEQVGRVKELVDEYWDLALGPAESIELMKKYETGEIT